MHKESVYLVQTDTTAGFLSSDDKRLADIKQRPYSKKILQTVDSFDTLKLHTRIPKKFAKRVRRAKRTTYVFPNDLAFRVIDSDDDHHIFIKKFKKLYSTSANKSNYDFDAEFAIENCDVVVEDKNGFSQKHSSKIIRLNRKKAKIIR